MASREHFLKVAAKYVAPRIKKAEGSPPPRLALRSEQRRRAAHDCEHEIKNKHDYADYSPRLALAARIGIGGKDYRNAEHDRRDNTHDGTDRAEISAHKVEYELEQKQ